VHVVTKRPTDTLEGKTTWGVGNFGMGESNGFINIPLNSAVATRIAYNYHSDDGYMKSSTTVRASMVPRTRRSVPHWRSGRTTA